MSNRRVFNSLPIQIVEICNVVYTKYDFCPRFTIECQYLIVFSSTGMRQSAIFPEPVISPVKFLVKKGSNPKAASQIILFAFLLETIFLTALLAKDNADDY
ncbi:MAG: hypothetical protein CLLPBCKN_003646 [Chroococcidiopsis cubana SAG 39.79]|nr:hypothetical protein [Chroococcidiopsis cubana SAG 39.79]